MKPDMKLGVCGVVFGALGLVTLAGCGDAGGGDEGTAGQGGSTAGAGGIGGTAGGSGAAVAGGTAGTAGTTAVAGAAGVAGAEGNDGCPVLPYWKSLPMVGPWMSPNVPGPCTQTVFGALTTCHYDSQGRLLNCTAENGPMYAMTWQGDTLVEFVGAPVTHSATELSVAFDYAPLVVHLDATGRATSLERDFSGDGIADEVTTYVYQDCVLVSASTIAGLDEPTPVVTTYSYVYDAAGNLTTRIGSDGDVGTWTYDCW